MIMEAGLLEVVG